MEESWSSKHCRLDQTTPKSSLWKSHLKKTQQRFLGRVVALLKFCWMKGKTTFHFSSLLPSCYATNHHWAKKRCNMWEHVCQDNGWWAGFGQRGSACGCACVRAGKRESERDSTECFKQELIFERAREWKKEARHTAEIIFGGGGGGEQLLNALESSKIDKLTRTKQQRLSQPRQSLTYICIK